MISSKTFKELFYKRIYLLSFFIPCILMLAICILRKVYPFGNNTLLIWDCNGQYIDYFAYFKSIFFDNNNLFYTFAKNMGGDMVGLSAYYLMSPLNLIFLLFSNENLPVALFLIIILKISLCGFTFNYYLNKIYSKNWKSLIFSTTYAFIGYNAAYFWDVMWLDGVILLPLVALGINKIIKKENPYLYLISLALSIIFNYYIGFMICLFSLIYFSYNLILLTDNKIKLKSFKTVFLKYILFSLGSIGLASFWLIPTVFSLVGGKSSFENLLSFKANYKFIDIFTKFFTTTINIEQLGDGLPNIFCGMFIIMLVMLYFLNSKRTLKERIILGSVISIFLMCFHVNTFNLIWHGCNVPTCFPYRYSFIFSFILISIAYKEFIEFDFKEQKKSLIFNAIIFLSLSIIVFRNDYAFIDFKAIYLDVFIFILSLLILYVLFKYEKLKVLMLSLLILFQTVDLSLNMFYSIKRLQQGYSSKMSDYVDYISNVKPVIDKVKNDDTSFYRMEKTFQRVINDSMQFNYNGLTHFSSCEKTFVKSFVGNMGYHKGPNFSYYGAGATTLSDSFLGVKYLLSKEKINKPYKKIFEKNDISIYKNDLALPIAFCVENNNLNSVTYENDIFKFQNSIFKSTLLNNYGDILSPVDVIDKSIENLNCEKNDKFFRYDKVDKSKDSFINYKLRVKNTDNNYAWVDIQWAHNSKIFVNDKYLDEYTSFFGPYAIHLGNFKPNDIISLKVKLSNDYLEIKDPYVYSENIEVLKSYCNKLQKQACNLEKISSSHLKGNVNASYDNQVLLFTIPYEKGWKVTVDGCPVKAFKIFDALTGIEISKGEHVVEMKYIPSGFIVGSIISFGTVILLVLYWLFSRRIIKCHLHLRLLSFFVRKDL